ncbi:hypothetical protein [Flaviaesturariibacter amylovorans]|uniref:Glycosyl transferase n=1 Tax=Flaviaesturariibacter amylovorans TaxID=1084520 RepID=A0ABP8H3F5_9BACT
MKAIYTTTSLSHLYKVKTFAETFIPLHPDVRFYVVLVEPLDAHTTAAATALLPEANLLFPSHLPETERASIKPDYNFFEACCAYRPFFADLLFSADYGVERLIYMDSDLLQYESIEPAFAHLQQYNFLLTPHTTAPTPLSEVEHEIGMNRCGIYNAGFIGMKRSPETERFLQWWKDRMRQLCVVELSRGLFVDQIWLNLLPLYFEGVFIEKDPGYNVAYWNFFERPLARSGNRITTKGRPLRFVHYSGLVEHDPYNITQHMREYLLRDGSLLKELFDDYRSRLARNKALFLPMQPPQLPPKYTLWQKVKRKVRPGKYRNRI